ncbi:hypothetical protein N8Z28_01510, partial [bacterium]|nr:hypothetical protein [bacterium]
EKENKNGLIQICNKINPSNKIKSIVKIKKGGNSNVYKLQDYKNNLLLLKEYPNDPLEIKSRLKNELDALKLLYDFENVPTIINYNHSMDLLILEYIKGRTIKKITHQNLFDALIFVEQLYKLSNNKSYSLATEACLNANELVNQIDKRFIKFKLTQNKDLQKIITKLFKLYEIVRKRAYELWPKYNINKNLKKKFLTFSPSDFGFHNAILNEKNKLKFIDFEYFGLDDPVKLISDFLWHPGMELTEKQKITFTTDFYRIFKKDKYLKQRLNAAFSLYGIRWGLIILNNFINNKVINKNKLELQIVKSKKIYNSIITNNMEFIYDK